MHRGNYLKLLNGYFWLKNKKRFLTVAQMLKRLASIESVPALIEIGFLDFIAAKTFQGQDKWVVNNYKRAHFLFILFSSVQSGKAAIGRLMLLKEIGPLVFFLTLNALHADVKWTNMKNKVEVSRSFHTIWFLHVN